MQYSKSLAGICALGLLTLSLSIRPSGGQSVDFDDPNVRYVPKDNSAPPPASNVPSRASDWEGKILDGARAFIRNKVINLVARAESRLLWNVFSNTDSFNALNDDQKPEIKDDYDAVQLIAPPGSEKNLDYFNEHVAPGLDQAAGTDPDTQ